MQIVCTKHVIAKSLIVDPNLRIGTHVGDTTRLNKIDCALPDIKYLCPQDIPNCPDRLACIPEILERKAQQSQVHHELPPC